MEVEAGLATGTPDPFSPYNTYQDATPPVTPYGNPFGGQSNQQLPLVANAAPFQRADLYDEYDDRKSVQSEDYGGSRYTSHRDDTQSHYGSESYAPSKNMFYNADKKALLEKGALPGEIHEGEVAEEIKDSSSRRRWLVLVWLLTWWLPSPFLKWFGRMKRLDVRQAWREKLAINLVIWFICGSAVFVIAILGRIICPHQFVFNTAELGSHNSRSNAPFTAIRGEVFDLNNLANAHARIVSVVPKKSIMKYAGIDATNLFPVQVSALCNGIDGDVSPYVVATSSNVTDENAQYHDFRVISGDSRPDWYFQQMVGMRFRYRVGFIGYTPGQLRNMASTGKVVGVYRGLVYDLTDYKNNGPAVRAPRGQSPPGGINPQYMSSEVVNVFTQNSGKDVTKLLDELNIDRTVLARQKVCLRNLFVIGKQDNRNSPQCLFSTYILLALSVLMVSIIGFKFLAALSFSAARAPEDHDKFVICQVPCYTEGEESLRRTIDSLAKMKYDDKRKLLFIICDGMIVGSGNDRPTPRIVLDILGADPNNDPEPLSFLSLGEGAKQHNMGKVYSGLYECAGHVVPYLVLVKIGKPTERQRPGNRGKRDSQMVLMHFLNKVCYFGVRTSTNLTLVAGPFQQSNEPSRTGNLPPDQECDWSQSYLLRIFVHD
jgi:chitin synthase